MTGFNPYPILTPMPRQDDPRCGCIPAVGAPACGAPAVWHVAWRLTPGDAKFSLLCEPHMVMAQHNLVYVDRHLVEAACDMPGMGWLIAEPSRCVPATTDDAAAQGKRAAR